MLTFKKPTSAEIFFKFAAFLLITLIGLLPLAAAAQTLQYQGFLTSPEGVPVDGTADISTSIHDTAVGGAPLWQETQLAVPVDDGVFSIDLAAQTAFPDGLFDNASLWLEVVINGETLAPRRKLTGFPLAKRAAVSESLVDDAIETPMIGDGQVTPAKLAEVCVEGEVLVMLPGGWFANIRLPATMPVSIFCSTLNFVSRPLHPRFYK